MPKEKITEGIQFRLLVTPCCQHQLCWVNPRLPTFCPECGRLILAKLREQKDAIRIDDTDAKIVYHADFFPEKGGDGL